MKLEWLPSDTKSIYAEVGSIKFVIWPETLGARLYLFANKDEPENAFTVECEGFRDAQQHAQRLVDAMLGDKN